MRVIDKKNRCPWCTNEKFKTDLDFTIIDDGIGQYIPSKLIKFCPFCGRDLKVDISDKDSRNSQVI